MTNLPAHYYEVEIYQTHVAIMDWTIMQKRAWFRPALSRLNIATLLFVHGIELSGAAGKD